MHGAVFFVDEVGVVGGHHLYAVFVGKGEDALVDYRLLFVYLVYLVVCLLRKALNLRLVAHDFQVIIFPKHAPVPLYSLFCGLVVSGHEVLGDFSGKAGRAADKVFMVLLKNLVSYPGFVVHTLYEACRNNLHEVLVSVVVLCQEDEMVILLVLVVFEPMVVVLGYVHLAANNGLYYQGAVRTLVGFVICPAEELLDSVHVTVVCDGQGRHAQLAGAGKKLLYIR